MLGLHPGFERSARLAEQFARDIRPVPGRAGPIVLALWRGSSPFGPLRFLTPACVRQELLGRPFPVPAESGECDETFLVAANRAADLLAIHSARDEVVEFAE